MTDDEGTAWTEFVHEGDQVKAIVIDINLETKKISLGLKASLFPQGASDDEDEDEEDSHASDDGELEGDEDLEDGSDDGQDIEFDDGESAEDSDGEMEVDDFEVCPALQ